MDNIKKITGWLLASVIWFSYLNLYSQNFNQGVEINRAPVSKKSIEEDIQELHKKLPELIKKLQLDNKNEIVTDMGGKLIPGSRNHYVYIEKAKIKLEGENISEVTFIYDQSNDMGNFHEIREFINKNPSDQNASDLQVIYKNSRGEKEEISLKAVEDEIQKIQILLIYRDNLNGLVRWLNFYAKKDTLNQKKIIRKVLSVGAV
ncbi:MAG: hypothetical protein OEV78_08830 [Spirochaetia bacterium]|nr:hypothetical protein [Spirochaetia bacterium]